MLQQGEGDTEIYKTEITERPTLKTDLYNLESIYLRKKSQITDAVIQFCHNFVMTLIHPHNFLFVLIQKVTAGIMDEQIQQVFMDPHYIQDV